VTADIGLSPIPTDGVLQTNAPLKVLEYLNLSTPVVATDTPDQRRVLKESGAGRVVPYDTERFTEALIDLLQSGDLNKMGRQGEEYIENHRSYEILAQSVLGAYDNHVLSGE
jgi:glycosyltransferase involved in cell wall biosynthesis